MDRKNPSKRSESKDKMGVAESREEGYRSEGVS